MPSRKRARRALVSATGQRTIRRDPRGERELSSDYAAPRIGPGGRPRRDPRLLRRQARWSAAGRLRIDRSGQPASSPSVAAASVPTQSEPMLVQIDTPAFWIGVVPDYEAGRLSPHDRDVFGAARRLADGDAHQAGAVVALVFEAGEDLGAAGADRVLRFEDAALADYAPDRRAEAVIVADQDLSARHWLFPDTPAAGGDVGRRVGAKLGEPLSAAVHRLRTPEAVSRGDGGRTDYSRVPPRVLLMTAECDMPVGSDACYEARQLDAPSVPFIGSSVEDRGLLPVDPGSVPLAEAEFVISAGNGVTDWDAFHALAEALGAAEGGSRVVCDAGLLARERQVGASGTLIEARCYLAFGISGAPQHLQGIARCEKVVAINTDLHAEMVKRSDLSAIKDAQLVMPALTQLLRAQSHAN